MAAVATPTGTLTPTATVTGTPPATPTSTATATPTPPPAQGQGQGQGAGDDDKDGDRGRGQKLTDDERRQKDRTNASSESDERVEGNVLAVYCDRNPPEIIIGNRDGDVTLRLARGASGDCKYAEPGMYLTSDNADKQHEQLYDVFDFSVK